MANILKSQYDSVYSEPLLSSVYTDEAKLAEEELIDIEFTPALDLYRKTNSKYAGHH